MCPCEQMFQLLSYSTWQGNHEIWCEWKLHHHLFLWYFTQKSARTQALCSVSSTVYLYDNWKCKHFRKSQIIQLLASYKIQWFTSLLKLLLLYSMFCSQLSVLFVSLIYIIIHLSGAQRSQAGICSNVSNG